MQPYFITFSALGNCKGSLSPEGSHDSQSLPTRILSDFTRLIQMMGVCRTASVQGYKAQSEMVLESLDKLIGACEGRRESMVVEGVHLSLNAVIRLMAKHPSIVPFLVHISNEAKHRERFAVGTPSLLQAALALVIAHACARISSPPCICLPA